VPTIFINHLVNLTWFPEAPNGSIILSAPSVEGRVFHTSSKPTSSSFRRLHHCCMGIAIVLRAASDRSDSGSVSRCQKGLAKQ
jgi:hypothetical protein